MKQDFLAKAASEFFSLDLDDLKKSNKDKYAWPRNVCMYLGDRYSKPKVSKTVIARYWDRDRTIVYNAVKRVTDSIETDRKRKQQYEDFKEYIVSLIKK